MKTAFVGRRPTRILDVSLLGVLVGSAVIFYWLSTHGTWNPLYNQTAVWNTGTSHFFVAQAVQITHGKLSVLPKQLNGDCFEHAGNCFGYFGLTPSLLRMPFLPLLRNQPNGLTPVYITAALTLATGSTLATLRHVVVGTIRHRTTAVVVGLTALGFGAAGVLAQLANENVYDEAVAWAVAFLALAVYCFLRWWEDRGTTWYVVLLVSLVLATNARPTAVPFALIVGAGVAYRQWTVRSTGSKGVGRALLFGGALVVIPIGTALGVFLLKFGTPIPSYLLDREVGGPAAFPRWIHIRMIDHGHLTSLRFVPTALVSYLRPDALRFTQGFPWIDFRFRTVLTPLGFRGPSVAYVGLRQGSLYTGTVSSLTDVMPLVPIAAVGAIAASLSRARPPSVSLAPGAVPRPERLPMLVLLVAALASWGVVLTGVAIEERFLADTFPLLAVVVFLAVPGLIRWIEARGRLLRTTVLAVVVAGTAWQLLVNLALTWRYPGA